MTPADELAHPLGCTAPPLGARARLALARPPSPELAAHLATCRACRLERHAFASLDAHAKPPSPAFAARLRNLTRRG